MADPGTADVQAELQDYLNSKNINTLFIQIVESLLIEKPDNPIGFIVEYLRKKYPDQAGPAVTSSEKTTDAPPEDDEDADSDEDEDDDDDYVGDMDDPEPPKIVNRGQRRVSVCAESPSESMNTQVKVVPKSDEETARILEILKKNVLFKHLDSEQMNTVKDAMTMVKYAEGDCIIKQGDDGDNFYVLDDGAVHCSVKKEEDVVFQMDYGVGDSFGELAIMYNAPRAATCEASTACSLWALDRVSFKVILMKTTISKRNIYKGFLQQVPILAQLTEYEILTIADALQEESFSDGEVICKQGDTGDTFYIIKEGTAVCSQKDSSGAEGEVARLSNGAYFGEIALLTSKPRQATVSVVGDLKCLTLDRKTFKRVMGPLQDILMRNLEQYNKFQAANI
jgi:cAMP-dependent protein kinase regulator